MPNLKFNWKVAGYAGEGIMTTGLLMSKTCARHGLRIFDYTEYPSLIRGGHNTYQVLASQSNAFCQEKELDILVALNKNALSFHIEELKEQSLVIYDKQDDKVNIDDFKLPCKAFDLPMVELAEKSGGKRLMANNVALGASISLLGLDFSILEKLISEIFAKKGEEIIKQNVESAKEGYNFSENNFEKIQTAVEKKSFDKTITATGNEAIGLGAIAGGLQLYVAYPMTPSSSILHFLAAKENKGNFVVKHAEDEISSVNMALGASFSGVRSMVGTSGGGFCYMTEALGLSGIAELPLVIVEAMRPGPALGMPTWTAQGDLQFVLNSSQDEFPRFILAPSDGSEAFQMSKLSLELSEKFQTVVILLSDKYLSESRHTIDIEKTQFHNERFGFENNPTADESSMFPRYQMTENGISNRSTPGMRNGEHIANSYIHDKYGFTSEEAITRVHQMDKIFKKFEYMKKEIPEQFYLESEDSKILLISFGSTKGVVRNAREKLEADGINSSMLNISWIWPFPSDQIKNAIEKSPLPVVVEGNNQGQLSKLIAQETGIIVDHNLRRYDGRPFYTEDIVLGVKKLLS